MKQTVVLGWILVFAALAPVQSQGAESAAIGRQVLPGNGLSQHDFLYAGESKQRRAFIIRKGQVVWFLEHKMTSLQMAWRLPTGNTLVNNWFNEWSGKLDRSNPPVQAVEFTPDKKIVWVLQDRKNLGPATTAQFLDEPGIPEKPGDLQH